MKINTNSIGNYNPYNIKTSAISAKSKPFDVNELISGEEKEFFKNLYPEQKTEIADYHFYQRSGKMSGVSIGSLFDRKM